MSAASREKTCPACGRDFLENDRVTIEPLIDPSIRYIAVHWGCSTFTNRRREVQRGH